jgi:predicted permease
MRIPDNTAVSNLRYAIRRLRQSPAFTVIAVLTLALSIGATTAIFAQLNAVFFKSLPLENPEELRRFGWNSNRRAFAGGLEDVKPGDEVFPVEGFSYSAFRRIRDESRSFSDLACWQPWPSAAQIVLQESGPVETQFVSGNYFKTLGVQAVVGRTLTPDDDRDSGTSTVAMVSYAFWQRHFGGDRGVLNRTLHGNGVTLTVIGVLPREFHGLDAIHVPDLILPLAMSPAMTGITNALNDNRNWVFMIVGRLRAGVPEDQARAETEILVRQSILANPPNRPYELPAVSLLDVSRGTDSLRRAISRPLRLLTLTVSIILLITCVNIAGLLLARGTSRQKEIATRLALGAPRATLVRQLLTECLVLAVMGGAAGLALTYAFSPLLARLLRQFVVMPIGTVRDLAVDTAPDLRVLGFSLVLLVVSAVVFGLAPSLAAARVDLVSMLNQSSSKSGGRFRFGRGKALIALQVGLSMILLVGAGLLIRTVNNLRTEPLGLNPEGLLFFRVDPGFVGYPVNRRMDFFENAIERLGNIPGVTAASGSGVPPLGVLATVSFCVPGSTEIGTDRLVSINTAGPKLFETWGVPLIDGRDVRWGDAGPANRVLVVNEAFAKKFYPDGALGRTMGMGQPCRADFWTIAGVVADSKRTPRTPVAPTVYVPYRQLPTLRSMTLAVRTTGDPIRLVPAIRRAMAELDSTVPIFDTMTAIGLRDGLIKQERLMSGLLVVFGAVAAFVCCLGIYGMLAYMVSRQTTDIGIRMALGARRSQVIGMVMLETLLPVAAGILLGVVSALALTRWIEAMLFGVSKNDPLTIAAVIAVFVAVAGLAAYVPARRASRVDPLIALRHE